MCDPIDGSPPGSPVPGILRQEHWSGLPFPSPMHECETLKRSRSAVSDPQRSHGLQPTRLLCPWDFPGKSTGVGCHCLLRAILLSTFKTLFALWTSNQCKDSINSSDNETLSFSPVLGILLGTVHIHNGESDSGTENLTDTLSYTHRTRLFPQI